MLWVQFTPVFNLLYVSFTPPGRRQHRGNFLRVPTRRRFSGSRGGKKCYTCESFFFFLQLNYFLKPAYPFKRSKEKLKTFSTTPEILLNCCCLRCTIVRRRFLSPYQARWGTEENCAPPLVLGPSPPDFPHCSLKGAKAWESRTSWNNVLTRLHILSSHTEHIKILNRAGETH